MFDLLVLLIKIFNNRVFIRVFVEDWVIKKRPFYNTHIKNKKFFSINYYKGDKFFYNA